MVVLIAMLAGVREDAALVALFGVNASMILFNSAARLLDPLLGLAFRRLGDNAAARPAARAGRLDE